MNFNQLFSVLIFTLVTNLNIFAMQPPIQGGIPVTIANLSEDLCSFNSSIFSNNLVALLHNFIMPKSIQDKADQYNNNNIILRAYYTGQIMIFTKRETFLIFKQGQAISLYAYHVNTAQQQSYPDIKLIAPVVEEHLVKDGLLIIIQPDSSLKLAAAPSKPDDGRPNVPLLVYEKLVGALSYATPGQLLGLENGKDAKKAYRERIATWHPDRNKSPEAPDALKLINWAAEKLKIKSSPEIILEQ